MNIEPGWIAAACAVVTALVTVGTQWVRYERLIAECKAAGAAAKAEAESALQLGAEAAKECAELEERIERLLLDGHQERERMIREFGETAKAIRDHMHMFETWSRDEFVRKDSFREYAERADRVLEQIVERIEKRLEHIDHKLDGR